MDFWILWFQNSKKSRIPKFQFINPAIQKSKIQIRFLDFEIFGFLDFWIYELGFWSSRLLDFWIFGFLYVWIEVLFVFWFLDFCLFYLFLDLVIRFIDFVVFGFLDLYICSVGFLDFWMFWRFWFTIKSRNPKIKSKHTQIQKSNEMFGFWDFWISGFFDLWIGFLDFWSVGFLDFGISWLVVCIFGFGDFWTSRFFDFWIGFFDFWSVEFLDFWISWFLDCIFRFSDYLIFWFQKSKKNSNP